LISFLKIIFFNFDRIKIHTTTKIIAIIALITDEINQSRSPNPEIDIGPRRITTIPPPAIIKIHIVNKNPNKSDFKTIAPSKMQ